MVVGGMDGAEEVKNQFPHAGTTKKIRKAFYSNASGTWGWGLEMAWD